MSVGLFGIAFALMIGMMLIGIPIAVSMALVGIVGGIAAYGVPFMDSIAPVVWGVQNENLLTSIPLFVLLGELLLRSGIGAGWFDDSGFKFTTSAVETIQPIVDYARDELGFAIPDQPIYGPDRTISGFRLRDGRASYGLGLETFLLGFPVHLDWTWRTLFNREWEDALFLLEGGSAEFRKPRFAVWIGYDF